MRLAGASTRLLPWTICAMAALLVVKSVTLVRAAVPGAFPAASAAAMPAAASPPRVPPGAPTGPAAAPAEPTRLAEASPAPVAAPVKPRNPDETVAAAATPPGTQNPGNVPAPVDPAAATPGGPAADAPLVSPSERALLLDLRARRGELDARDAALAERETLLSAAEKRLAARVDELTALRARLEALEAARKDRDEANWAGLVKVYETMKPRDAAAIFNDLDLPVLLQVVDRMKEAKAAAVLAAMLPDRARQVTAELAQMRARANTVAPPAATSAPRGVPRVDTGSAVSPAGTRPETTPGTGAGAVPSGGRAAAAINGKGKT